MQKTCNKCSSSFEITDFEIKFLDKIAPVFNGIKHRFPNPEMCPDCRAQLRTSHRNEQFMYKIKSSADGKDLVSVYSPDKPYKIFSQEYWFSDNWDPIDYGQTFDFTRSFFEQYYELSKDAPRANMVTVSNENSEYTTGTGFCKNCYILNSSEYCEDCYYGKLLQTCKNCIDTSYAYDSEILYECFNVKNCYNCKYTYNSQNSSDCSFCDNVSSCKNCFLCTNLSMKEYYFMNQKMSKDEYKDKIKEFTEYDGIQKALDLFIKLKKERVYKYSNITNSENCFGDFIQSSKNCLNCYDVNDSEDCMNLHVGVKCKDIVDCSNMYINPELSYQVLGTIETFNVHFCLYVFYSNDLFYCENCYSCKNCFGCSGLRNKQYCIFNKQYSKENYDELAQKIVEHMNETQEWGRFFPAELSPFGYNETLANEYFPTEKNLALLSGFKWNNYESPLPNVEKFINANKLPNRLKDIPDDILNWAIKCEVTNKPFKIIPQELKFYREHNLTIPRRHPDQRHKDRMKLRAPRRLHKDNCKKCGAEVQTTYNDIDKNIYCEECYLKEVY